MRFLIKFPMRARPEKGIETLQRYHALQSGKHQLEFLVSIDDDDQATLAEVAELFGGTPLGDAALKEAQERREKVAKEAAANLAKMAAGGISPLRQ